MRKMILGCLGVVASIVAMQFAQADVKAGDCFDDCGPCTEIACNPCDAVSDCGPCDKNVFCDPCAPICGTKKSLWFFGGHLEAGVYANEYGVTDLHGKDVRWGPLPHQSLAGAGLIPAGNTELLQNVRQTDAVVNQIYVNGGKKLSKRGWDVGGEVGVMFGTDAVFAQSEGLEYGAGRGAWDSGDYYTALAEAFFEVGYDNLSVKAGKFFTPMGHEGLLSTDRFFYSLSNAFGLMPVTHSGVLATWDANKKFSVFGGWVNGKDKFFNTSDDNAFLGGFNFKLNKRVKIGYAVLVGDNKQNEFDWNWTGPFGLANLNLYRESEEYFVQNLVVDVKLNKKWNYTFEWTLRNDNSGAGGAFSLDNPLPIGPDPLLQVAAWRKSRSGGYGINQELLYKYNKKWSFGFRAEWVHQIDVFHDVVMFDVLGVKGGAYNRIDGSTDLYSFTLAANWTPTDWLLVRPELRYDKFDGRFDYFQERGVNGNARNKQLSGGVSAVVKF